MARELKSEALARELREQMDSGQLPPGAPLPTTAELRERYSTSTIQTAVAILRREGRIESRQGARPRVLPRRAIIGRSASYVTADQDGRRATWKQQLAELGMVGGQMLGRVGEVAAPDDVAALLGVEAGESVMCRPRVMLADDEPVQLADSYYPLELASGSPLALQGPIRGGVYRVLAEAGLEPGECEEDLTFPQPTPEEQERLKIGPDVCIVRMVRALWTTAGRPVAVEVMVLRADRHRLTYRLPAQ